MPKTKIHKFKKSITNKSSIFNISNFLNNNFIDKKQPPSQHSYHNTQQRKSKKTRKPRILKYKTKYNESKYNESKYNESKYNYKNKLMTETISSFYTFNNPISTSLIKYTDNDSKSKIKNSINNIELAKPYEFPLIVEIFKKLDKFFIEEQTLMKSLKLKKLPPNIKQATEDFTRGLKTFINARYTNLPKNVSNAFVKLWEIYDKFDIMPLYSNDGNGGNIGNGSDNKTKSFRVFHIAEAPGMMTLCTQYFARTKRPDITDFDWRANSLNPFNKISKKMGALTDDYRLIKNNPKKWLWGADNTGDITNVKNIKSFNTYINKQWLDSKDSKGSKGEKLDLITGDAGTDPHRDILIVQKLDLAQAIIIATCSHTGGNACVKHFSPYITTNPESIEAISFFISFIYLYYICFKEVSLYKPYTSNGDSGEFYIICKDFIGIDNNKIEKLYTCLDTFKPNYAIFPKDTIPETFILQINSFIDLLCNLNIQSVKKNILLLNCFKESKIKYNNNHNNHNNKNNHNHTNLNLSRTECNKFLDDKNLNNILLPRYNQWIKHFNFE